MAANLELVISGVDKASNVFKAVDKEASGLSKTVGTVLKAGFVAGAAGIGIATFAGIKFVQAAMEEEASMKRLEAAVKATGQSMENWGDDADDFIKAGEKMAFSDDDIRNSLALLTAQTGDFAEAQRRSSIAMDFARGAGIDLGTASKLLGKVTDENVNVLARYGIKVEEGADATVLLEEVQRRFAGQAAGFADSAAGKWAQFGNQMQNLKEVIGAALLPVVTLLGGTLVDITTWAIPKVEELAKKIVEIVTPVAQEAIVTLKEKFQDFLGVLETIAQSSVFQGFLDGVALGLGNVRDVAIDVKDAVVLAFQDIDKVLQNVPGFDKITQGLGDASKDAEGAKNVGKLFTEATAGVLAFSLSVALLDTSINIIGNSLGALGAVMTTSMAIFLAPNPLLLFLVAIGLIVAAMVALEIKTRFFSKQLVPALQDVAEWVNTKVIPALREFAQTEVIPRLEAFGAWIETEFIPVVLHAAQVFRDDWWPVIKDVATAVGEFLYPAFDTLHDLWVGAIVPALEGAVIPALKVLEDVISEVIDWFSRHETATKVLISILAGLAIGILLLNAPWLIVVGTILVVLAKWDEISRMFTVTIPQAIDSVITKIKELPIIGAIFTDTFNTVWAIVQLYVGLILVQVQFLLDSIRNTFLFWKAIFSGDWGAAWDALKAQAEAIWSLLSGSFGIALDAFQAVVNSKLQMLKDIGSTIGNAIVDGFKAAWNATLGGANLLPDNINFTIPEVTIGFGPAKQTIGGGTVNIPLPDVSIPELQRGGITTRDTLAFLHANEAVVPLQSGRGFGQTVEIHIHSVVGPSPSQMEELRQVLAQVMRQEMKFA